jgi:hypothetical protein
MKINYNKYINFINVNTGDGFFLSFLKSNISGRYASFG